MSLVSVGNIYYGFPFITTFASLGGLNFDGDNHLLAFLFYPDRTTAITEIGISLATVTTGDTLKASIQGVDVSGDPDGVIFGGGSPVSGTLLIDAADDDKTVWITLDNSYSPANTTTPLAIVVEYNSYVAGVMVINRSFDLYDSGTRDYPFSSTDAGVGSWTKQDDAPVFGINYSGTKTYHAGAVLVSDITATPNFNSGDNPNEIGSVFRLPFPARFKGVRLFIDSDNDFQYVLYENAGTPSALFTSRTFDASMTAEVGLSAFEDVVPVGSEVSLSKDTDYFLLLKPGAADIRTVYTVVTATGELASLFDNANCFYATRNGGAISTTNTQFVIMALILDQLDDGTGTGGGPVRRVGSVLAR